MVLYALCLFDTSVDPIDISIFGRAKRRARWIPTCSFPQGIPCPVLRITSYLWKQLSIKLCTVSRGRSKMGIVEGGRTGVKKDSATNLALAFNYIVMSVTMKPDCACAPSKSAMGKSNSIL